MSKPAPKFYVGTSGWSYQHWKSVFYPDDLPFKKWFGFYTREFSTVEINATFYRFYEKQTYQNWYDKAPEKFIYVLKTPRLITHRKKLLNVQEDIRIFWENASALQEKLGLYLLQLPPKLPYDPNRLLEAILAFPDPERLVIEFRDQQWYNAEIRNILKKTGSTFCSIDAPGFNLVDWTTSETGYIRLHGRNSWYGENYEHSQLMEIRQIARQMTKNGANQVFVFFNNDIDGHAAKNALDLSRLLTT